jgi:hypothetical protein
MPRSDLRLRHIPVGPVAVFGASNFPLAFSVARETPIRAQEDMGFFIRALGDPGLLSAFVYTMRHSG